ncbi:MAG: hypothetical protein K6L80_05810 [Agarilytica sp.]
MKHLFIISLLSSLISVSAFATPELDAMIKVLDNTIEDYNTRARYPDNSRALNKRELDPILARLAADPHSVRGPSESDPVVTFWPEKQSFQYPEPVVLYATVAPEQEGETLNKWFSRYVVNSLVADIENQQRQHVTSISFADDGKGADARRGDGIYTASFDLGTQHQPDIAASFLVKIQAETIDGRWIQGSSGFLYSNPHIRTTGKFKEVRKNGDLQIAVEVNVDQEGEFHIAGSLYNRKGDAIGWAQNRTNLTKGKHWLPLDFYGLMFNDHKVSGPLTLKNLSLSNVSSIPNATADLLENAYRTKPLRFSTFRKSEFKNQRMKTLASKMEKMRDRLNTRRLELKDRQLN